jgi:hypothetical protein
VNRDSASARARRRQILLAAKGGNQVATRLCLSCERLFLSEGPWNRICPQCSERHIAVPPRAHAAHIEAVVTAQDLRPAFGE